MRREVNFQTSTEAAIGGVLWCEKVVLGNFAKFTRKHLCQSFSKKLNTSGRLLLYPVGGSFPDILCAQSFNLLVKLQVINSNKAAETICKSQKKGRILATNCIVFLQMVATFYATEFILFLITETWLNRLN